MSKREREGDRQPSILRFLRLDLTDVREGVEADLKEESSKVRFLFSAFGGFGNSCTVQA